MTKQTEALKLALEAYLCREWWAPKIASAIKEALAQSEQEPVVCKYEQQCLNGLQCLCATPPMRPWVGLTEDDLVACSEAQKATVIYFMRKLKEKNT